MSFWRKLIGGGQKAHVGENSRQTETSSTGIVRSELKTFNYEVVGESNYQEALKEIAGGYARDSQSIEGVATLVLEPDNPYDPNAVRVDIEGKVVGYIPAKDAKRVGGALRLAGVEAAHIQAQIGGGWKTNQHDQGHFGVKLKLPRRNLIVSTA